MCPPEAPQDPSNQLLFMKRSIVLGVDIAKRTFDVCWREQGQPLRLASFGNDPAGFAELCQWLGTVEGARVGMEATGSYWVALATELRARGALVYVLNPAYVRGHGEARGRRQKTDRADAALIADYVWRNEDECEAWEPVPEELAELRELMRLYQDVTQTAAALGQRREGLRTAAARALLEEVSAAVKGFAKKVLKGARAHARKHESLRREVECLESIKGVGAVSALALAAELPRGRAARQVACWAGVTPGEFESGSSVRKKPRLCKKGSDYVRKLLYWPAITALRCNPAMQEFGERMKKSDHSKMQVVGAAMHKLLRWAVGVLNTGKKFDPSLHGPPAKT